MKTKSIIFIVIIALIVSISTTYINRLSREVERLESQNMDFYIQLKKCNNNYISNRDKYNDSIRNDIYKIRKALLKQTLESLNEN